MFSANTLTELIESNRSAKRDIVYLEGENEERRVPYGELHERALGILHHLQRIGARQGDKLILHVASNEQFIDAYWACLYGGIVPVPVAPGISDEHKHKLLRIAKRLGTPFLYTDKKLRERLATFAATLGEPETWTALKPRTFLIDQLEDISKEGTPARLTANDVAFIQFSSGSTSEPKGVVLTHGNILANAEGSRQGAGFSPDDVSLSWMPLTHDMGLIGFHLFMLYAGVQQHLMPTDLFVRRALLWLKWCSEKRVTVTCSPNFGYRHCLRALGDKTLDDVRLDSVRLIFNGAEPISVELAEEFLDRMAPYGLKRETMFPVYGLAEASLAISFPPLGRRYQYITVDRRSLGIGSQARFVATNEPTALKIMSEGQAIPYAKVKLVDDAGAEVAPDTVGHLLIAGDNVTRGYFENPEANAAALTGDGWLRTGDLALWHGGELHVTGRAKEIIFVNGQNYYPHDLEGIAIRSPGLELGKVVVSGVRRADAATDEIVVFVLHRGETRDFLPIATDVAHRINSEAGLEVAEVVPVKRIPKTTSGKIQRHLLEEEFLDGAFAAELAELRALREALRGPAGETHGEIETKLKAICDAALGGRTIGVHDNLFDLGASSLKLIEIHEAIDRLYPNQVDLTELFDYPTIAELAGHLQGKLAASA